MPTIVLNGERRELRRLKKADLKAGTFVRDANGRNVYRLLCRDEGDMVVRNARHPDIVRAFPLDTFLDEFVCVI